MCEMDVGIRQLYHGHKVLIFTNTEALGTKAAEASQSWAALTIWALSDLVIELLPIYTNGD